MFSDLMLEALSSPADNLAFICPRLKTSPLQCNGGELNFFSAAGNSEKTLIK